MADGNLVVVEAAAHLHHEFGTATTLGSALVAAWRAVIHTTVSIDYVSGIRGGNVSFAGRPFSFAHALGGSKLGARPGQVDGRKRRHCEQAET